MTLDRSQPKKPIILVADDDPLMGLMAAEALEEEGLAVETAKNGRQAVASFISLQPDLVLLDVNMPEMDGFSACREIRKSKGGDRTPVLMMTGLDDLQSINQAYEAGATDFQSKPVNWVILKQRIRYMLRARDATEAMLASEAKNRALLMAVPDLMFRVGRDETFLDFKPAKDFDPIIPPDEFIGKKLGDVLPQEVSRKCSHYLDLAFKSGQTQLFEYPLIQNGQVRSYEARSVVSGPNETLTLVRDITEQKEASQNLQKERDFISAVLDTARALVVVRDSKGRIERFNRACESATGYKTGEVEGREIWDFLLLPEEVEHEKSIFQSLLESNIQDNYQIRLLTKEGKERFIVWSNSVMRDRDGVVEHVISTGIDITELKKAEEQLQFLAYYDGLTSLPNRVLFKEHLSQALAYSQRHERLMAVLFLDLDRFKQINDSFGHSLGDLLLKSVAERLRSGLRLSDCLARQNLGEIETSVGRFGGDEFTVLVPDISGVDSAAKIAQRLLELISQPFELEDQEIFVTASIGISVFPYDGSSSDLLLKNADAAMHAAKEKGRSTYQFYSAEMHAKSFEKLSLENDLRKALIGQDEFRIFYQPKHCVRSGAVIGAEALIRWQHPAKGLIPPADFVPLAEETGLIVPIGEWVLRSVCRQNMAWMNSGLPPIPIAVNLSCVQFRQKSLLPSISGILNDHGMNPQYLELEITESTIMENREDAGQMLRDLKSMGIQISIDDFGTGYSSLSYLKRFTLDALKIDRSFIKDLTQDPDDLAITLAIIAMAHSLGLKVIAEGVETQQHFELLKDHGCDAVQGFLFSRPLPADEFLKKVMETTNAIRPLSEATPINEISISGP